MIYFHSTVAVAVDCWGQSLNGDRSCCDNRSSPLQVSSCFNSGQALFDLMILVGE